MDAIEWHGNTRSRIWLGVAGFYTLTLTLSLKGEGTGLPSSFNGDDEEPRPTARRTHSINLKQDSLSLEGEG